MPILIVTDVSKSAFLTPNIMNEIESFLQEKARETNYKSPTPKMVEEWIEEYSNQFKEKAKKWDELEQKIGLFINNDVSYIDEDGNMEDIRDVTSKAFGYA
jgi:hypothetical protein